MSLQSMLFPYGEWFPGHNTEKTSVSFLLHLQLFNTRAVVTFCDWQTHLHLFYCVSHGFTKGICNCLLVYGSISNIVWASLSAKYMWGKVQVIWMILAAYYFGSIYIASCLVWNIFVFFPFNSDGLGFINTVWEILKEQNLIKKLSCKTIPFFTPQLFQSFVVRTRIG